MVITYTMQVNGDRRMIFLEDEGVKYWGDGDE